MEAIDVHFPSMAVHSFWAEHVAGAIAGAFGVMCGHPMDTLKVRLQSTSKGIFASSSQCLTQALRRDGILTFFRGLAPPLLGNLPLNSLVFGAYGNTCAMIDRIHNAGARTPTTPRSEASSTSKQSRLQQPIWQVVVAGSAAGLIGVPLQTPMDVIKIRMQMDADSVTSPTPRRITTAAIQPPAMAMHHPPTPSPLPSTASPLSSRPLPEAPKRPFVVGLEGEGMCRAMSTGRVVVPRRDAAHFRNSWECAMWVMREHGVIRGLMHGAAATCVRDAGTYGVYFGAYEWLCCEFCRRRGHRDTPTATEVMTAGGTASTLAWFICHPFDVVKSSLQARGPSAHLWEPKWMPHAAAIYRQSGWRGFTRGLLPSVVRAFPVGAVTFGVYELVLLGWERIFGP
ncbi:unnamed protein product [Vitrella brassicaformis CCMP3155]|uniref:Mitochondrial carrier protein n=2 Tax=Vitrella brassicaformis TaxID=1169539 RepID=A0A0G4EX52_VITBC|nr:unnamed protein product [Vitrella brassicaformis CCMP3155]|mmetsp:Transcript_115/g.316  ORF Transcript_115/g.316 Transcript_115/m.316 type:complete len:398 (+) Transcript_115:81-1274(+)|eukprot:CEM03251.1 unnamed protein product [Vitrella brassicaformis CCMP3155]